MMNRRGNQVRPEVEELQERCTPAAVVQGWDGVITIYGTGYADFVQVGFDPYGDVIVNNNGFRTWFPGWSVTGVRFFGYAGNDWFYNNTGYGCYCYGGAGADYLYGGWGTDYLYGGAGVDYLYGYGGVDYFYGGVGVDTVCYDGFDPYPGGYSGGYAQTDVFLWMSV